MVEPIDARQGQARGTLATIINGIAKFVAVVFATLFVNVTVATLLLSNVQHQLLRPDLLKRALVQQHIYERFPALAAEQIVHSMTYTGPGTEAQAETGDEASAEEGSGPPEQVRYLAQADYEAILSNILPTAWLQTQVESVLDQAFSRLDSDTQAAAIKISMAEVKARIAGEEGVRAALQVVRSWPPCTDEQRRMWATGAMEEIPTCRPPEELIATFTPAVKQLLTEVATEQIPDEIDLSSIFQGDAGSDEASTAGTPGAQDGSQPNLNQVLRGLSLIPLLPFALLLLVTLFGVRSVGGLLRWWGIPSLIAGLIGIGLAVSALPAMNWALAKGDIATRLGSVSGNLVQAGLDVGRYIARSLATRIAVEAAVIALLGLVLLGLSSRLANPRTSR